MLYFLSMCGINVLIDCDWLSVPELREQLEKFERQLALIPRLVVQDKLQELMEESKEARAQLDTDSNMRLNELEKSRVSQINGYLFLKKLQLKKWNRLLLPPDLFPFLCGGQWSNKGPFKCYVTQMGWGCQIFQGKALQRSKVQWY